MGALLQDRRVVDLVYLSTLGTWAAYALLIVVLPFRFQQLGLSVVEYGGALAAYAFGTLVTEGLWGFLAFRIGSARSLGVLGACTTAAMLALGFTRSFVAISLLLGVYGALVVYSTPLIRWLGMNAVEGRSASRGLGRLGLFFGIGLSAGTAAGPLLYSVGGFWLNVALGSALFAASTVPLLLVPWDRLPLPTARSPVQISLGALFERRFVVATFLVVLYFVVYTLVTNFLQYYSIGLFHGSLDAAGYVIGAARAASLLAGLLVGPAVDRWGAERAAPLGFALLAAGALAGWFAADYAEMIASTLALAVGAGVLSVTLLPLALARVAPVHQGTAVGVFGSFEDFGLIVGPLFLGFVYSGIGPRALFPASGGVAFVGLAVALAMRPRNRAEPVAAAAG